jgi:hypothetical protein
MRSRVTDTSGKKDKQTKRLLRLRALENRAACRFASGLIKMLAHCLREYYLNITARA